MKRLMSLTVVVLMASAVVAVAQQSVPSSPKPKSPGEIAEASRVLAEKNESCRREAQNEKLAGLKRRRFIRECVKKNRLTGPQFLGRERNVRYWHKADIPSCTAHVRF